MTIPISVKWTNKQKEEVHKRIMEERKELAIIKEYRKQKERI